MDDNSLTSLSRGADSISGGARRHVLVSFGPVIDILFYVSCSIGVLYLAAILVGLVLWSTQPHLIADLSNAWVVFLGTAFAVPLADLRGRVRRRARG